MKASVIISLYNNTRDLQFLLPSLTQQELQGHEMEIIIRDDGSTDGSYEWIKRNYPECLLIKGDNAGFSRSNNIAVNYATGDAFVFVNADTILDFRFVAAGLELLNTEPGTGGVNCSMIMPWVMDKQDFIEGQSPASGFGYFLTSYGFVGYQQIEKIRQDTSFLSGGGCFVRRKALENENPFSENLCGATAYCEDLDLSLRLMAKGWRLRFEPGAIIYHNQRPVTGARGQEFRKFVRVSINRISVYAFNLTLPSFLRFLPRLLRGLPRKVAELDFPARLNTMAVLSAVVLLPVFLLFTPFWVYQNFASGHQKLRLQDLFSREQTLP